MTEETIKVILILQAALLLHFGLSLTFGNLPSKLLNSAYSHSRRLMGCVFLLLSAAIFGFYLSNIQSLGEAVRVAYNLTLYYAVSALMTLSFVTLIGRRPRYRSKNVLYLIISVSAFAKLAYGFAFFGRAEVTRWVHVALAIFLLASIIGFLIHFFRRYKKAIERGEEFYSEDIDIHIGWMKRSLYSIIGVGILSSVFAFSVVMPPWFKFLYLIYFIGACSYIYISFIDFVKVFIGLSSAKMESEDVDCEECEKVCSENCDEPEILAPMVAPKVVLLPAETLAFVSSQLGDWVAAKNYCQSKITIKIVAQQIYTNRLYLSTYINTTYNCSFRVWISTQRIAEAKRIMKEEKIKSMTLLSTRVGFMSLASFTHTFKRLENISPRQWMEENVY